MTPNISTEVATPIRSHDDLIQGFEARRRQIGVTMETLSEMAGLPDRYVNKLVCKSRGIGPLSFAMLTCALGVEVIAFTEPDDDETNTEPHEQEN